MNKLRFCIIVLTATILLISSRLASAQGMMADPANQSSLTGAMVSFHSASHAGEPLPDNSCTLCHPGPQSQSLRNTLASMGIGCTDCHGEMSAMNYSQNLSGIPLLICTSCHTHENDRLIDAHPVEIHSAQPDTILYSKGKMSTDSVRNLKLSSTYATYAANLAISGHIQTHHLQINNEAIVKCDVCHPPQNQQAIWHFGSAE